jgi:tetratricopeptide (TPR) repeat protein
MTDDAQVSLPLLVDSRAVRRALEKIRQAEPLGKSPLANLAWIRQRLEGRAPAASREAVELAIQVALTDLIEDELARLRAAEGIPHQAPARREAAVEAIRADFSQANVELEAWSAIYHRYALTLVQFSIQEIAASSGMDERNLRRRMGRGYRRLTEQISEREHAARKANWLGWLRFKLPPPSYTTLYEAEPLVEQLCQLATTPLPPHTIIVTGPGGIGKTALAHAAAKRLIEGGAFEDFAWITLEGAVDYRSLLAGLAENLGYLHLASAELTDLEAGLRVKLAETPTLAVIDNGDHLADYAATADRLAALAAPGKMILTARQLPTPVSTGHTLAVQPLSRTGFEALLHEQARRSRIGRIDSEAVGAIYRLTGGNPLAGRLLVSRLAFLPLARVMDNLAQIETPEGVRLYEWLFEPTWDEALDEAARLIALALVILPAEGATWADLRALTDLPEADLDRGIERLITGSLVDPIDKGGYYVMHSLTRHFVEEQAGKPPYEAAYRRLLRAAGARARLGEGPGEASTAIGLLRRQVEVGEAPRTLGALVGQIAPLARRAGQWLSWREILRGAALALREDDPDSIELNRVLFELGIAHRWLGDLDDAVIVLEEAITRYGEAGDFGGQARALFEIGQTYETLGQSGPAYEAYQRAAAAASRHGLTGVWRRALGGLAGLALQNDRALDALDLLGQVWETFGPEEPPDGPTLSALGSASLAAGEVEAAINYQEEALRRFVEDGDLPSQARALLRLGIAYHRAGDHDEALHKLGAGLRLMRMLGDALGQGRVLTNLGALYIEENRFQEALAIWGEAIRLQELLGDRHGMAYSLYNLADLQWKIGQAALARETLGRAEALARDLGLVTLLAHITGHPLNEDFDC